MDIYAPHLTGATSGGKWVQLTKRARQLRLAIQPAKPVQVAQKSHSLGRALYQVTSRIPIRPTIHRPTRKPTKQPSNHPPAPPQAIIQFIVVCWPAGKGGGEWRQKAPRKSTLVWQGTDVNCGQKKAGFQHGSMGVAIGMRMGLQIARQRQINL